MTQRTMARAEDLVGLKEIGERLHVSNRAVSNWRDRMADFPKPFATFAMGSVWLWDDIDAWATRTNRARYVRQVWPQ